MNFEIDTGSQPALILSSAWAVHLGMSRMPGQSVTLADGTRILASVGRIGIEWLDGVRDVEAIVFPDHGPSDLQPFAAPERARHGGRIDGLLGRHLLREGGRLAIDYTRRTAVIEPAPAAGH